MVVKVHRHIGSPAQQATTPVTSAQDRMVPPGRAGTMMPIIQFGTSFNDHHC
jgi:hypothetical protein